jgi:hypothetical protein
MKIDGIDRLKKELRTLADPRTAKKILRRASTAAIRPMLQAVKAACPVNSGDLRKGLASKVSVKSRGASAIVGIDTARIEGGAKATEPNQGPRVARHLHLVLFGHITPEGKAVAGNNFMERGYNASHAQSLTVFESKLKEGIENAGR